MNINVVRVTHSLPFRKKDEHFALFLEVERGTFMCVFTTENVDDDSDYAWVPSALYNLTESEYTQSTIDTDDIYQVEESLLNFFISHSKKMDADNKLGEIRIPVKPTSKPAF